VLRLAGDDEDVAGPQIVSGVAYVKVPSRGLTQTTVMP